MSRAGKLWPRKSPGKGPPEPSPSPTLSSASHPSHSPRPASRMASLCWRAGAPTTHHGSCPRPTVHTAESPACPRQACKGQAVTPADRCWEGAGYLVDHCCCGCRRPPPQLQLASTPISSTCPLSLPLPHARDHCLGTGDSEGRLTNEH